MAVSVKHAFTSAIADGSDASLVRPSNWNAEHSISGLATVVASGTTTLAGQTGVTITHNLGTASYRVHVQPTGATPGDVGDISIVRAANTVVIYNSGQAGGAADYLIIGGL